MPEYRCKWCRIKLHSNNDKTMWIENIEPNCPENPSKPENGHSLDLELAGFRNA